LVEKGTPADESDITHSAGPEPGEITLEPAILDRYVGFYSPHNGEFGYYTITRNDGKLVIQIGAQPPFDLYPLGEAEFAMKVVEARITFVRDVDGQATGLVLRQHGVEIKAVRIDAALAEQ